MFYLFDLNNKTSSNILSEEQQIETLNFHFENPKLFCEPKKRNTRFWNHTEMMTTVFIVAGVDEISSAARREREIGVILSREREIGEILSRERDRRDLLFF